MARSRPSASLRKHRRGRGALPSAGDVVSFIRESPSAVGKREIARAFGVPPAERPALRDMLRQIERSGAASRAANRRLVGGPPIPEVTVVERFGSDADGIPLAAPARLAGTRSGPGSAARRGRRGEALPIGARAAARLVTLESGEIEARDPASARYRRQPRRRRFSKRSRRRAGGAGRPPQQRRISGRRARCRRGRRRRVGCRRGVDGRAVRIAAGTHRRTARARRRPGAISLLSIASFDIPTEFPPAAIAEAEAAPPVEPGRTHRSAGPAAGHDRRQRRARFRRRSVGRAGPRPGQRRRLASRRRDRRCRLVCPSRQRARPRGASGAATRSISPTASCRCCPRHCRTSCARLKPGVDRACLAVASVDRRRRPQAAATALSARSCARRRG